MSNLPNSNYLTEILRTKTNSRNKLYNSYRRNLGKLLLVAVLRVRLIQTDGVFTSALLLFPPRIQTASSSES